MLCRLAFGRLFCVTLNAGFRRRLVRRAAICTSLPLIKSVACQSASIIPSPVVAVTTSYTDLVLRLISRLWRNLRLFIRSLRLFISFSPLALLYPFVYLNGHFHRLWLRCLFFIVQFNGPAVIKLFQWASTRRDLFSDEFCDKFSLLQRRTRPRCWKETERILEFNFGPTWSSYITNLEKQPIGSGCIAQVFKAEIDPNSFRELTGFEISGRKSDDVVPIAIKVAHPSILDEVTIDLEIMEKVAYLATWLPSFKYLNPLKSIADFRVVMEKQTDLRHEGQALTRFREAFPAPSNISFPQPLCYTKTVLVETFEEGEHINNFLPEHKADTKLKHLLALSGVEAVFKMIFSDNFVHGDLHPGNILVRIPTQNKDVYEKKDVYVYEEPKKEKFANKFCRFLRGDRFVRQSKLTSSDTVKDINDFSSEHPVLIFLDTGITTELEKTDLSNIRALFRAIVFGQGEYAGELLLSQAPQQWCSDSNSFKKDVAKLVEKTRTTLSLKTIQISSLLSELFSISRSHHVCLESNFTCVVLAVMVLEGLGRSLDPNLDLIECARPFLL